METRRVFLRRLWLAGGLAAMLAVGAGGAGTAPVMAHEAKCPYCSLDVVQDTPEQDFHVVLKYGRKRIEYRCVFCALAQAKSEFKGDVTILAPSEIKGKPVLLTRSAGKWSAAPNTVVFVAEKVNHRHCQTGYRAFTTRAAFDAHVKKHAALLKDARPLTLAQMVEVAK